MDSTPPPPRGGRRATVSRVIGDILQPTHLLFVLVVALLVLGPKRLPEVARQLGSGLRDFRAAISGEERHEREPSNQTLTHEEPRLDEEPDMSAFHSDQADPVEPAADAAGAESEPERAASEAQQGPQPATPQPATPQPAAPQSAAPQPAPPQPAAPQPATPQPVAPTDKPA
jgi:TatA/E family protein of Tat protein translocase